MEERSRVPLVQAVFGYKYDQITVPPRIAQITFA
jgi:hypothetical protein